MDVTDNSGTIKKSMNITIPDVENKYNDPSIDMPFYHFWVGHEIDNNFDPIYYHSFESYFEARFIYVAPLRHHGTMYPLSKSSNYSDVGLNGEYTAAVFDSHFFIHVSYIPVKNLYSTGLEKSFITRPLNEALKYWLNYLCVADDVKSDLTKYGYELRTLTNINNKESMDVNLSNVGTGVSQILPILVSCLIAHVGSILVFEQPELHLHPRVQSRLADFFLSMALIGKQCIIETHSEYFIDMLRLRICQSLLKKNKEIKDLTKIYYFDKDGLKTIIKEIEINEYGDYNIWPEAFFDERQRISEEILNSINETMFKESDNSEAAKNEEASFFEEEIYIDEDRKSLKYLLFNDLNELFVEGFKEKGINFDIASFPYAIEWQINPFLSENVKTAMNKYNVNYSTTTYTEDNNMVTIINKRDEDEWLIATFSNEITEKEEKDNPERTDD